MRPRLWALLLSAPFASQAQPTLAVDRQLLNFTGIHRFLITNPWGPLNVGNIQSPQALTLSVRSLKAAGTLNWRVQAVSDANSDFGDWLTIRNVSALGGTNACGTPVHNGTGAGRGMDCQSSAAPLALQISYTSWWPQLKKQPCNTAYLRFTDVDNPASQVLVRVQAEFAHSAYSPTFVFRKDPASLGCTSVPAHYPQPVRCTPPAERPPSDDFEVPAPGGSYIDDTYGGRVRVLSPPRWMHAYSSISPFNLTGDKLVAMNSSGAGSVVSATDFTQLAGHLPGGGASDWWVWSRLDPNILYHTGTPRGPVLQALDVTTGKSAVIRDFTRELGPACPGTMCRLVTGGQMDASRDDWLAFQNPVARIVCAYDVPKDGLYCADYPAAYPALQATNSEVMISKGIDRATNKRYLVLGSDPHALIFSAGPSGPLEFAGVGPTYIGAPNLLDYDANACTGVRRDCLIGGHHDTVEDADGTQWLVHAPYAGGPISTPVYAYQLNRAGADLGAPIENGGGVHQLFVMQFGFGVDVFPNYHIGCARDAPYCVISTGIRDGGNSFQGSIPGWNIGGVATGDQTIVTTEKPHTLKAGDLVNIGGVVGVSINGVRTIAAASENTFTLGLNTTGQTYQAGTGACAPGMAQDRRSNSGELILVKVAPPNSEQFVRKIAMHRSVPTSVERDGTNFGYFAMPRAALSSDASQIVFSTNFGEPTQYRLAIAETGVAQTPVEVVGRSTSETGAVIGYRAPAGEACDLALASDGTFSNLAGGGTRADAGGSKDVREWRIGLDQPLDSDVWYGFRIVCPSGSVYGSFRTGAGVLSRASDRLTGGSLTGAGAGCSSPAPPVSPTQ